MSNSDELERNMFSDPCMYDKTYSQHMTPKDLIARLQCVTRRELGSSQKTQHNIFKMNRMIRHETSRDLISHGIDLQPRTVRDRLRAKLASKFN